MRHPVGRQRLVGQVVHVFREGRVIAEQPKIVTPSYLSRVEGFSAEAKKYFDMLMTQGHTDSPGLFYAYRNEPKELNIVSDNIPTVVARLNDIDNAVSGIEFDVSNIQSDLAYIKIVGLP